MQAVNDKIILVELVPRIGGNIHQATVSRRDRNNQENRWVLQVWFFVKIK